MLIRTLWKSVGYSHQCMWMTSKWLERSKILNWCGKYEKKEVDLWGPTSFLFFWEKKEITVCQKSSKTMGAQFRTSPRDCPPRWRQWSTGAPHQTPDLLDAPTGRTRTPERRNTPKQYTTAWTMPFLLQLAFHGAPTGPSLGQTAWGMSGTPRTIFLLSRTQAPRVWPFRAHPSILGRCALWCDGIGPKRLHPVLHIASLGAPSARTVLTIVVSTASCAPWKRGRPSATTSRRRLSALGTGRRSKGCTQRQCEISKDIVDNYRTMFESRISVEATEKLSCSENLNISLWSYDMVGHAKKCVDRYCELANKTTQQLYKVSTPCIDDHHFKEKEELKSVGCGTTRYSMVSEQTCTINQ